MSMHPNVLLIAAFDPNDLPRKTLRAILADSVTDGATAVTIGGQTYISRVLESNYDNVYQIGGKEGEIIFSDMVTYGYGKSITWADLSQRVTELSAWAQAMAERHHCTFEIRVSANYW